jgi:hypothetical protein
MVPRARADFMDFANLRWLHLGTVVARVSFDEEVGCGVGTATSSAYDSRQRGFHTKDDSGTGAL